MCYDDMKISIITTTYNSATTVQDTFQSILRQTYSDIESIVVDGESKDGTLELIKKYEALFEGRMHYISEPDKGIYDAMNKGIRMATGDVIGILNSDDFYTSPIVLERVVQMMENSKLDAVYGDVHFVNDIDLSKCVRYYSSRYFRRSWMRFGFMPAHPSFYCRKEIYEKYGLFDTSYKVAADFENLLRLIFVNKIHICYLPMDFVTMRTGGASTSGLVSHKQILRDHLNAYQKNGVYSNVLFESFRYVYKLLEILCQRLNRKELCQKLH